MLSEMRCEVPGCDWVISTTQSVTIRYMAQQMQAIHMCDAHGIEQKDVLRFDAIIRVEEARRRRKTGENPAQGG